MTLEVIALIFSGFAIIISTYSWHKSRAIYGIKKYKFPKNVGNSKTDQDRYHEKKLNDELKSGEWQVVYIYERKNSDELMIVIGKIKKWLIF